MGTSKPQPLSNLHEPSSERLDSWKEIAAYLKRDERTVRRWEKEGLPVRRKVHKKQASVFAYRSEIDDWWHDGQLRVEQKDHAAGWKRFIWWGASGIVIAGLAVLAVLNIRGLRDRVLGTAPVPAIRSLAVLPLENLSGDASQEYFVDGMTDALITDLAQISNLKVISRTSVMQYKGARRSLLEVAHALGVDAVVEGSVVRSGPKVRITAQLIYAPKDQHIWAENFEGPANDVLAVQDNVARAITERIQGKLGSLPHATAAAREAIRPEAYEDYVRGLYFFDKREPDASKKSVDYFRKALAREPRFALAQAGLAEALPAMYWFNGRPPVDAMPEAKEAARRALDIDDNTAEAHTANGGLLSLYDWNWSEAERELKRALELNPNSSLAHERYMMLLLSLDRIPEAVMEATRAQQLDPLSFFMNRELGHSLYVARRYDEALGQLHRSEELEPSSKDVVLNWVRWIYEMKGKQKEAVELELSEMEESGTQKAEVAALRAAYETRGWNAYWTKWLQLHSTDKGAYCYDMALVEARLGHADKAWDWMEKSADRREVWVIWIKVDPLLDGVRSHPGYKRLLHRIHLAE